MILLPRTLSMSAMLVGCGALPAPAQSFIDSQEIRRAAGASKLRSAPGHFCRQGPQRPAGTLSSQDSSTIPGDGARGSIEICARYLHVLKHPAPDHVAGPRGSDIIARAFSTSILMQSTSVEVRPDLGAGWLRIHRSQRHPMGDALHAPCRVFLHCADTFAAAPIAARSGSRRTVFGCPRMRVYRVVRAILDNYCTARQLSLCARSRETRVSGRSAFPPVRRYSLPLRRQPSRAESLVAAQRRSKRRNRWQRSSAIHPCTPRGGRALAVGGAGSGKLREDQG